MDVPDVIVECVMPWVPTRQWVVSVPMPLRYWMSTSRDLKTWPLCRRGSLRIIAAITQESVITRILRHCKLASVPPPIAPARLSLVRLRLNLAGTGSVGR